MSEPAIVGFFERRWHTYTVIVLDKTRPDRKRRKPFTVEEFTADSPAALIERCAEAGYNIGSVAVVERLCSAPG